MSRLLSALVVLVLALGYLAVPRPGPPGPDPPPELAPAPVAVCPVQEGSGRTTTIAVASSSAGPGTVTLFTGGIAAGSSAYSTGASGTVLFPMSQVAAVGTAAALVEMPSPTSAAGTVISAPGSVGLQACPAAPTDQALVAGGSTLSGESFQVQLINPYAGEARVELTIRSESGLETVPELAALTVPPRSSVVADLDAAVVGRAALTVTVETTRGQVLVAARQGGPVDEAVWNGMAPAQDWYLPIPAGIPGEIVVAAAQAVETPFQVDVYGSEGLVEAAEEGVAPPQGSVSLDLTQFGDPAPGAIRVISAQPVAVFFRSVTPESVAVTAAAPIAAIHWLFPGGGATASGAGRLALLNTGLEDATVVVTALRQQSRAFDLVLPPGQVYQMEGVEGPGDGYSVHSSEPLVALWLAMEGPARALTTGVAFNDG